MSRNVPFVVLPIRVFEGRLEVALADPLDCGLALELEDRFESSKKMFL